MENSCGLLVPVGSGGRRGGVSSGGSSFGSISTVSKEDNLVLSSEVSSSSSSYPDESELELGLELSLGGSVNKSKPSPCPWGQYARILTARDFPSLIFNSFSSSSLTKANDSTSGTKRAADSVSPPRNGVSPVVGWPPIQAYRMNRLASQGKSPPSYVCYSSVENFESKEVVVDKADKNNNVVNGKQTLKTSQFVKVNMDGVPIGRKVDLSAHSCYETLAQKLEIMFCRPNITVSVREGSSLEEQDVMTEAAIPTKPLDGSSCLMLAYEDKEGDWMLVGDMPWRMFVNSVRRLRIMRKPEDNGLALSFQERDGRPN